LLSRLRDRHAEQAAVPVTGVIASKVLPSITFGVREATMDSERNGSRFIVFGNDAVEIRIQIEKDGTVVLQDILSPDTPPRAPATPFFESSALPLCEIRLSGEGNATTKTSKSLVGTYISRRLRLKSFSARDGKKAGSKELDVEMHDEQSGITAISHYEVFDGVPVVRSSVTVRNDGPKVVVLTEVCSAVVGGLTRSKEWWADYKVSLATNTWFREAQWRDMSLSDVGLGDVALHELGYDHLATVASFSLSNRGTFSTQGHLPMGLLKHIDGNDTWLWQVENNGSWMWEIGDYKDDIYLAISGPNANNHEWRHKLAPGDTFTSTKAAVCHVQGDADAAFQALTRYRRRIRREHSDYESMPIIFNDYMNCLMGDPTEEKVLPLLKPAAQCGAEYYVMDAGWYADDNDWWDDVGAWEPSTRRFPKGLKDLLDKIHGAGLKVGIWVEPEVIGVRSSAAGELPDDAYFQRNGERIIEKSRYHLDFRHPAVIKRMDKIVHKLVTEYGVEYFKFDYNIEVTQGTEINSNSAGEGQLGHNRAYLAWVESLLERYPGLVIENCSSGAQRMDYAMLAVHTLQSTSDQQHPVKYAAIAAAIFTAVVPEQAATWAYPQPDWDDETNALTVVNSLLGRVHLSGRLDMLSPQQLDLICEGMEVYKSVRGDISTGLPFWPLGLAKWHDDWLACGLQAMGRDGKPSRKCYLAVWRRGGDEICELPLSCVGNETDVSVQLLYPAKFTAEAAWNAPTSALRVRLSPRICARLFSLTW
jgi:alpha-galactosidase